MDLNNLSLDELLAQIKGDSGYQQAAQQSHEQEPAEKSEIEEIKTEPVIHSAAEETSAPEQAVCVAVPEIQAAADEVQFDNYDLPEEDAPREPDEQFYFEDISQPVAEAQPEPEAVPETADKEPTALESLSLDELLRQVSGKVDLAFGSVQSIAQPTEPAAKPAETPAATSADDGFSLSSLLSGYRPPQPQRKDEAAYEPVAPAAESESIQTDSTEAAEISPLDYYAPEVQTDSEVSKDSAAVQEPEEPIEVVGQDEEETDTAEHIGVSPLDYYDPTVHTDPEVSEKTAAAEEIAVIEEPEEITEPAVAVTTYEPLSAQEPVAVIDEEDDDDVTVYTPAVPEPQGESSSFSVFGNINIDADIASLFPTFCEDDGQETVIENPEETPAPEPKAPAPATAEAKTINIGNLAVKGAVFERPGIVTGRKMFGNTADLRALPAIMPADELLKDKYGSGEKTFVRTGSIPVVAQPTRRERPDDAQMLLPGFGESVEAEHVDEETVENELRKSRSRKVDSFKLEGVEPEEPQLDDEALEELNSSGGEGRRHGRRFSLTKTRLRLNRQGIEYTRPSDRKTVYDFIRRKKRAGLICAVISAFCTLALIVTTSIAAVAEKIDLSVAPQLLGGRPFTYLLAIALLVVGAAAGAPVYSQGITCFFNGSGKPNSRTPVFIAVLVALIQATLAIALYDGEKVAVFAPAATLAVCMAAAAQWIIYSRVADNFEFLVSRGKEGLFTVQTVDNTADANNIGKNVVMGEAEVRYSGKTRFAGNFLAYSLASDSADDLCVKLVPIVAGASLLIAVIAGLATKNIMWAVSLFSGALCMGAPASAAIVSNLPLTSVNKKLRKDGGIITGYAAAFEYESTNAIAIDAAELFPGAFCDIHGMKTFTGVRLDEAILTAASMLISAGGPISSLFNDVVMGRKELLMNVEELAYEDKLGLSGWIRGRRVFLGNRKLLENHNIEIPMQIDEARYRHDGRRVLYLADAGKIAAIFVVSYGTDVHIAEYLRKIESNGINILIRTTDSNITEEFVANCFGLPINSVKVVSSAVGEVLKSYADRVTPKSDAQLLHNGSAAAFLHSVSAASSLCSTAGIVSAQQSFCTAAGLLLMAVIVMFSGAANVSALQVCICQLVWLAIGAVLPLIERD